MNFLTPHTPKDKIQTSHKGNLLNMKFLCKDMCHIKGFKTSCGNPDFYKHSTKAIENAPFLQKILNEGAILEGVTICDEFFYSIIGENIHYGTPINKNALNCVPGGSSSGSAAALTQMDYDFTIGTDTGGSVRVPASFCGVFGFMLNGFWRLWGGKSQFSVCLRVIGRWATLLGSFSSYFEPNLSSWSRVMSNKPCQVNEYLHNGYLHLSVRREGLAPPRLNSTRP